MTEKGSSTDATLSLSHVENVENDAISTPKTKRRQSTSFYIPAAKVATPSKEPEGALDLVMPLKNKKVSR
jgi:hypothetical protein